MKTRMLSVVVIAVALGVSLWLGGCRKQEIVPAGNESELVSEGYQPGIESAPTAEEILDVAEPEVLGEKGSLNVSPSVGSYPVVSSGTLSGTCGTYIGGMMKARVTNVTGSLVTIEILTQSGAPIQTGGTYYWKGGNVCGTVLAQKAYVSGQMKVSITANIPLGTGIVNIYPVLHYNTGARYWASPILVYTLPMCISSTIYGTSLGTVNGVTMYCNPSGYYSGQNSYVGSTYVGKKWQCVEGVNRYYYQVYGKNITNPTGNANTYYGTAYQRGLVAYANGTITPRIGDILCMSGGNAGTGHVAIVIEVQSTWIKIAQQNGGSTAAIGYRINRSGNTLQTPWSGYTIQGLLRCQ